MDWDLESVFGLVVVHSYLWLTSNPDFRLECSLDRHPGNAHNLTRVRGHGTWLTRDHVSRFSPFGRWTLLHYLYFCFSEETKHGIGYWLFHKGLISFIIGGKLRVWSGPKEKLFSHLAGPSFVSRPLSQWTPETFPCHPQGRMEEDDIPWTQSIFPSSSAESL